MREKMNKIANKIIRIIASKYFFWAVIVFFVLQSMWIVFSSAYPLPYDEIFHFGVINIFGHQWSPFILAQPTVYDVYGNLAHGDATIFHYLMSFPHRIVSLFTSNLAIQVVSLRMICVAMASIGLLLFNKLFQKIGIKQIFINVSMLLFVLLPISTYVSATVNYDNMLFPLTAIFLIICVDILLSKEVVWSQYAWFIIVGCIASLVKYSFLPVFAIGFIYLVAVTYKRHGRQIFSKIFKSFHTASRLTTLSLIGLIIIATGMFSAVYVQNTILYGSPRPDCEQIMSQERCEMNKVFLRYSNEEATKNTRTLMQTPDYVSFWFLQMARWTSSTVYWPLPIVFTIVFVGGFVGLFSLAYAWKLLKKQTGFYFLATISTGLTITVFLRTYVRYIEIHAISAIQPRYLLSVVPIILVMMVISINFILKSKKNMKLSILLITLLLFTQGGGLTTYILQYQNIWYWQNSKVIEANNIAKKILRPLVKEK